MPIHSVIVHELDCPRVPVECRTTRGAVYERQVCVGMPKISKRLRRCCGRERRSAEGRLGEGLWDPLGPFVADSVEISERKLADRDSAVQAIGLELERVFPALEVRRQRISDL